ncbi:MAG: S-methyl-5-thioribose-1-phosphate isomerase, partial [Bryobacteraceae bacterium]
MVETIRWSEEGVVMIDQRKLPHEETYVTCRSYREVAEAIRAMVIRGAPAIGVAAAMGVALGMLEADSENPDTTFDEITRTLAATRPTAV